LKNITYPLTASTWDHKEESAIRSVIDSGVFSMGKEVSACEMQFANFTKSKFAVMVNSGSSANLIMTAALFYKKHGALKSGDEIIVPAVSWSTTYFPLYQYGLKMKFVDVDLETLNYDLLALESAITNRTKAIMIVNLLGNPNDFSKIKKMIQNKNIYLIEDNCESMGAIYKGQHAGTFGVMGTFSCYFSHHISTMEGGFVVTNDEELYHILLCLRSHGWTRNLPKFNQVTGSKSDDDFLESFRFVLPGYNLRPLEMSGAIGQCQIEKLPSFIEQRRKNAEFFKNIFGSHEHFQIQKEIGESSWFGFSFLIRKESSLVRSELVKLLMDGGVECRPIVSGNFAKSPVLKWFKYEISSSLKNANQIDAQGFFVGNHHYENSENLRKLKTVVDDSILLLSRKNLKSKSTLGVKPVGKPRGPKKEKTKAAGQI
jgi:CDP-4-dehydro-6-deoxyglucose reductase, E1